MRKTFSARAEARHTRFFKQIPCQSPDDSLDVSTTQFNNPYMNETIREQYERVTTGEQVAIFRGEAIR